MHRHWRIVLCVLSSLLILPITTHALDPNRAITQYVSDFWDLDKGLPDFSIPGITQTPDGYLWLATFGGLSRFDGVRFKTFDSSDSPEIPAVQYYGLLTSRDGTLWAGTYSKGLLSYKNGKFRRYTKKDGLSDERIVWIYEDRSGNLWLGTPTGLMKMHNNQFTSYGMKQGLPGNVWSTYEDSSGIFWAGTIGEGLYQLQGGNFVRFTPISEKNIYCLLEDSKKNFWIGTAAGLYRMQEGKITKYTSSDIPGEEIPNLLEDSQGNVWITTDNGLARFHQDRFESLTTANGFPGKNAGALFEDREQNLWVSIYEKGLVRLHDGKFVSFSKEEGLAHPLVSSIYGSKNGDLWLAHGAGISRLHNGKVENFLLPPNVAQDGAVSVFEDSIGTVWIGTNGGGLHTLVNGKITRFPETEKLLGQSVRHLYEDRPGSLWVGNFGRGVNHIENGKVKATFTQKDGLSSLATRSFHKDKDGSLLLLAEGGVDRYQDGRFSVYIGEQLLEDYPWTLYRDKENVLWMGSNGGGLKRYENGKVVSIKKIDGLLQDSIGDILEDSRGNFWISCDSGIFTVSKKELNDFANGKISRVHCRSYGKPDGMKTRQCDYGFQPSAWKSADGKLWFPTFNGVTMIDPENMRTNTIAPPVLIEDFVVDDKIPRHSAGQFILEPGDRRLEFHYTALSLRNPDRVKFRYKLEGYDQDWREGGTRRTASYTSLPPRSYRFRVIACNDDDVWNEAGASLSFRMKPFFYQTGWFYSAMILTAIGLGFAAYRVRVRSLKAREEHLLNVVEEKTGQLRQANSKLLEAQERITRLIESQPESMENIPAWSESIAIDIAQVIGASGISVWIRKDETLQVWNDDAGEPVSLDDLQRAAPFSFAQTEKLILPVLGASGDIFGALTVSGKSEAWGETEKRLIYGFANQLGSTLEMQKMRQDLASARQTMVARIQEFSAKGIATLQVCSHCSRCFDDTASKCPVDGAPLKIPQILPYRVLNRYRMIRLLGQGGTGSVFQAEDEKLKRYVAIKVLRKEQPEDAAQLGRWEREARTVARLHHPGIVSLFDIGELEDGSPFLIMEFLQGVDMAKKIRIEGPGTPSQVALLLEQVGDALKNAHDASVIHRDLKPANLFMIASESNPFQMKVVDFGLAKSLNENHRSLTMTGVLIGSPSYMSPEQIRGQKMDQRSDVFSLAAVTYEMLTGKVAFSAPAVPDVLVRILTEPPPPLSIYIQGMQPDVQEAFDWALEKDPAKRPDNVLQWVQQIAPRIRRLLSPFSGWDVAHLHSELSIPPDPETPTSPI